MNTNTIRVGLDTTRCAPELRAAVEHGASTLTIYGPRAGRRVVRFRDIEDPDGEGIAAEAELVATLPMGRLLAGQVALETRSELDMMRQATGIEVWVVVSGDLAEQWQPDGGPGGTPVSVAA